MNTGNLSWELTEPMGCFAALWLADSVGSFSSSAGPVRFTITHQFSPNRCVRLPRLHSMETVADEELNIKQHTSQYFASRMINLIG
jgi:hypothetical protein